MKTLVAGIIPVLFVIIAAALLIAAFVGDDPLNPRVVSYMRQ